SGFRSSFFARMSANSLSCFRNSSIRSLESWLTSPATYNGQRSITTSRVIFMSGPFFPQDRFKLEARPVNLYPGGCNRYPQHSRNDLVRHVILAAHQDGRPIRLG